MERPNLFIIRETIRLPPSGSNLLNEFLCFRRVSWHYVSLQKDDVVTSRFFNFTVERNHNWTIRNRRGIYVSDFRSNYTTKKSIINFTTNILIRNVSCWSIHLFFLCLEIDSINNILKHRLCQWRLVYVLREVIHKGSKRTTIHSSSTPLFLNHTKEV